jgi:mRNA interferase RelE/StbE
MTNWSIQFIPQAEKELKKLDPQVQRKILNYLENQVLKAPHPRTLGKALAGKLKNIWRYRFKDYRILCRVEDDTITILVLRIAHRKEVYDAH